MAAPLTSIKGIGPRRAEALGEAGLSSVLELAYFAPRSYIDYREATPARDVPHGQLAAVMVRVTSAPRQIRIRGSLTMTVAEAASGEDKLQLVWYNQPYRAQSVKLGMEKCACGRMDRRRGAKLVNATFFDSPPGIVPVYPAVAGISQKVMRDSILLALEASRAEIEETLPAYMREKYSLAPLYDSLYTVHAPKDYDELAVARRRLAFEDMLLFSLMLEMLRGERAAAGGFAFQTEGMLERFRGMLPFPPTGAQERAMREIAEDMASPAQMNRLLQGDVGSGKTAVALFAMFIALENGKSAALMAPTEILARQHYETLQKTFGKRAVLLLGGMKKKEREAALSRISEGPCAIIGTHALLTIDVEMPNLGLVIADEQHRFGVRQRAAIGAKGRRPDTLIMSATPIPRTLSLIIYGDLDVSVLDELPPGRKPIATRIVPMAKRDAMYDFIKKEIDAGRQAYAVCPIVERSEAMEGVMSVTELFAELSKRLPVRAALLHGRLAEKDDIARRFRAGEIDLLVSTTVVEVGVDVPNASVMVIEGADRFGLAQLHQLRGRVGRGAAESFCFLLSESDSETARERLATLVRTSDGFEIAEADLAQRGPGEFLGSRQHGLSELGSARFAHDMRALADARAAAEELLQNGGEGAETLISRARELLEARSKEVAVN